MTADIIPLHPLAKWHSIKISNDSKNILVSTNSNYTVLANGEDCLLRRNLGGYANDKGDAIDANFTPDGKFVMCGMYENDFIFHNPLNQTGSGTGLVNFWDAGTGALACSIQGHNEPTLSYVFYGAGSNTIFI